jgi:gliding motility-associated-like protein
VGAAVTSTTNTSICSAQLPYQWNGQSLTQGGTYTATLKNTAGCDSVATLNLTVEKAAVGTRYPAVATVPNQSTALSARFLGNDYTYLWTPPEGLNVNTIRTPIFKHDKEMQYLISIISNGGCITVDTLRVTLRQAIPPTCTPNIFVPKAWSPNKDGHNDKLFPFAVCMKEIKYFKVYNRWGELMFETNVIGKGWDGLYKGYPMVSDVYTWTVEAIGVDDEYYKRSGNSILLR